MEQLTGADSMFLYEERGNNYNHITSLGIYDPSTAPGGKVRFKQILAHFAQRMNVSKVFRRQLVRSPFNLDRPYWLENAEIDLEYHVRHIALPAPGDWRQLMILVARITSRPLDQSKPLWEMYVIEKLDQIEGLPKGAFAVMMRFHHASLDGQAGNFVIDAVHSHTPDTDDTPHQQSHFVGEAPPTQIELYSRMLSQSVRRLTDTAKFSARNLLPLMKLVKHAAEEKIQARRGHGAKEPSPTAFKRAPVTRFNAKISPHRVVEAVGLPLADMAKIRAAIPGVTINDIFVCVVSGAMRRYLESKGELPDESLRAMMPINVRAPGAGGKGGNAVAAMPITICSDIADPIERIRAIQHESAAAKSGLEAMGPNLIPELMHLMPNFASHQFLIHGLSPQVNTTISNVRGSNTPVYVAGARAVAFYPVSVVIDHIGINHTGFSYNDILWLCVVACRKMVPDPEFYKQCLLDSFAELHAAACVPNGKHAAKNAKPRAKRVVPKKTSARTRA